MAEYRLSGGLVVDGTGTDPFLADVSVRGDRITAVRLEVDPDGDCVEIDVRGLIVAPGFIDIHTHSDVSLLLDGRAESKIHQGVTTEVVGNCGFSAFPLSAEHIDEQLALLAGIGDDPVQPSWLDFSSYARALEKGGVSVNVAALVGHGQLRLAASGRQESLSELTIERMCALLDEAIGQGAFGLSTGLTYVPSSYATFEELHALARVLVRRRALYATHGRGEGATAIQEAIELAKRSGVRVQYSHVAVNDPKEWGTGARLLSLFDTARAEGADIACDIYPYDASASALTQYLPAWVQEGGPSAMRRRLDDPAQRRRAERELAIGWGENAGIKWLWDRVVLSRTDGLCGTRAGENIMQAARRLHLTPAELTLELCRQGGNRVQVVLFYRLEDDVQQFLSYEHSSLGSDGSALPFVQGNRLPHPRGYGAHARLLGRYVRELGLLDLATAIHKMTAMVADRIGIVDRGRLLPGLAADIVVFDPERIVDRATFVRPNQPPDGVAYVFVNGELVVADGRHTDARPGRVLRSR